MTPYTIKRLKSYYGWQRTCVCCRVGKQGKKEAHKRLRPWLRVALRKDAE